MYVLWEYGFSAWRCWNLDASNSAVNKTSLDFLNPSRVCPVRRSDSKRSVFENNKCRPCYKGRRARSAYSLATDCPVSCGNKRLRFGLNIFLCFIIWPSLYKCRMFHGWASGFVVQSFRKCSKLRYFRMYCWIKARSQALGWYWMYAYSLRKNIIIILICVFYDDAHN